MSNRENADNAFIFRSAHRGSPAEHGNKDSGVTLPIADKRARDIAALEVELAMTEAHAKRLLNTAPNLADPNQQHEMAALIKEESDRAEQLRNKLRLLRDQS